MKKKNNILSVAIGAMIAIPLSVYVQNQQELQAEKHKHDCRPQREICIVENVISEDETEETAYFDVPLSEELQAHIFAECEEKGIAPSIVVSIIAQESNYDSQVIGDDGYSKGLMQVQQKWHEERMDRLGCTDLLDPFQNVTVAVDYLAELKDRNQDLYFVLMAYNGGASYANEMIASEKYSDYALEVTKRAVELESRWN